MLERGSRETTGTRAAAFNNRGVAYADEGDLNRAITDFNEAIRLDPEDAYAFNNRGNASYKKGEYDRAIADYEAALMLDPHLEHTR